MRVLLVSQEMPPETGWGGIGTYVGIIAPALVDAGAEVHVLSVVRGQGRSDAITDCGVHVHRRPLRRPPGVGQLLRMPESWNRASLAAAVAWEVRRLEIRPDVIEAPEWMAEGAALALGRTPLVVRLHSSARQVLLYLGDSSFDARVAMRIEEGAARRADLLTGTRPQIDMARSDLGIAESKLCTITYPVVPAPVVPMPDGPPRILFAARFTRRKGLDTAVRAMVPVLEELPEARLAVVGRDGVDAAWGPSVRAHLTGVARTLGVTRAIDWVERWGPGTVTDEAAQSHVVVVPSQWESFGYTAAEALSLGRPVVASDIPALADVVDDGVSGHLAPAGDVDAWGKAVVDVLEDPRRAAAMGEAGASAMRDRCAPDRIAALTLDAYAQVLR